MKTHEIASFSSNFSVFSSRNEGLGKNVVNIDNCKQHEKQTFAEYLQQFRLKLGVKTIDSILQMKGCILYMKLAQNVQVHIH